jgi:transcriptional regulator with XRE-family HTH domain
MLSRALKLMRLFHEVDQATFAEKLGISRSYLSELESGAKQPTLDVLNRYAEVLRVPTSSILLLAENITEDSPAERVRFKAANKILRIMDWLAARNHEPLGKQRMSGTLHELK